MTEYRVKSLAIYMMLLSLIAAVSGCVSSGIADYSSSYSSEQKVVSTRTEMFVVKSDDPKSSRDYALITAVDYLADGKRNYYLIIAPGSADSKVADINLTNDYPYIIQGQHLNELVTNLDKCINEWDFPGVKYSASIYNVFIASPETARPYFEIKSKWYEEKKYYQSYPYIKFNYSKNEKGVKATLALGNRVEQIVYAGYEGKIKGRTFLQDDEKTWTFDRPEKLREFQVLLSKALLDLRSRGLEGYGRKAETKPEVKQEKAVEKVEEKKPQTEEKKTRKSRKKKR